MALGRFERSVLGRRWRVGSYGVASSRPRLNLEALGASRLCARSTWHDMRFGAALTLMASLYAREKGGGAGGELRGDFLFSSFFCFGNSAEELGMALGRFERSVLGRRWRVGSYGVASSRPRLNLEALGASRLCARSTWHDMRFGAALTLMASLYAREKGGGAGGELRGEGNRRKTRRLLTNRPCKNPFYEESYSKGRLRVSKLDCARTPKLCSQGSRRMLSSGVLSTCSESNPRLHRREQEFGCSSIRPSSSIGGWRFQGRQHRSARATQLHNGYAIDPTCHAHKIQKSGDKSPANVSVQMPVAGQSHRCRRPSVHGCPSCPYRT